jgi:type II secretory pathway pseudopilin PulG
MARGDRRRRGRGERGFTYLGLLALLVVLGLLLTAGAEVVTTVVRREREAQLLWVGHAYRSAIARYWSRRRAYPLALPDLLGTAPDAPVMVRDLRQLYPDPMTGAVDWVLLPAPDGGIMGVASRSARAPLKTAGFDQADAGFDKAGTYQDWQFVFLPALARRHAP